MLQMGTCGCTAECPVALVRRIVPGGALEVAWSGTIFTHETMPDECYDASCGVGQSCLVQREPAGSLTFEASAWAEVTGDCGGACTCAPDATGSCTIGQGDAVVGGTGIIATVQVDTLGGMVEILFE
jgi:hypothetical protein